MAENNRFIKEINVSSPDKIQAEAATESQHGAVVIRIPRHLTDTGMSGTAMTDRGNVMLWHTRMIRQIKDNSIVAW